MRLDHITSSGFAETCEDRGLDNTSTTRFQNARYNPTPRERERCSVASATVPATLHPLPGDNSCVEPPDPIPNSEVKRTCADGSVHLACESRSSPGFLPRNPRPQGGGFFLRAISTRHYSSDGLEAHCMRRSDRQASRWDCEANHLCRVCERSRRINLKRKRINLERMCRMQVSPICPGAGRLSCSWIENAWPHAVARG